MRRGTGHDRTSAQAERAILALQDRQARPARLDPPVCWLCDRKLVPARGRIIVAEDGHAHPAHAGCAARYTPPVTAQPAGGWGEEDGGSAATDFEESRP